MDDRLESIRAHWCDGTTRAGQSDVLWLLDEVQRLIQERDEAMRLVGSLDADLDEENEWLRGEVERLREECKRLTQERNLARAGLSQALAECDAIAEMGGLCHCSTSTQRRRLGALARGEEWPCHAHDDPDCATCELECPALAGRGEVTK